MKQSPELKKIQEQLKRGVITPEGFLGTDKRNLIDILTEDDAQVNRLGLTHEQIAEKMKSFRNIGLKVVEDWVEVDHFEVLTESMRGKFPCPFGHPGMVDKTNITVVNKKLDKKVFFTDLQIHLIEHHGFYQGKGSSYRLEPSELAEILEV